MLTFLDYLIKIKARKTGRGGEIGRHARLKILWTQVRAGSSPASGTKIHESIGTWEIGYLGTWVIGDIGT